MTNKEKVKDIANRHSYIGDDIEYSDLVDACEEMAEWKDAQFKEYLEKKREENHPYWSGRECLGAESIINKIINELFGGE